MARASATLIRRCPNLARTDFFHVVWVWRDTTSAETSHDPSYARSRDLVHWENSRGEHLALPITIETGEVVHPVPAGGGIINGGVKLGFDNQKRVIVSFIRYDEKGATQIYNARLENGKWNVVQAQRLELALGFQGRRFVGFRRAIGRRSS